MDAADKFTTSRYLSLATYRRSAAAVATPVWFALCGEHYYVFSSGHAGKVKRLRNSPRSRIAVCDARGSHVGEWTDARSYLVDDPSEKKRAYAALRERYGWQMALANFFSRLSGRIHNRALIRIELDHHD